LRVRVVHMKHFIAQNLLEDRARRRVVVHELPVDRETAGRRLLGDVEEREQPVIRLALDAQVVEAVATRQRVAVEACRGTRGAQPEKGRAALTKENAVVKFV